MDYNYYVAETLVEQAVKDAQSGNPALEEWGLAELKDLAKTLKSQGFHSLAHRASQELTSIIQAPWGCRIAFNGESICWDNRPSENGSLEERFKEEIEGTFHYPQTNSKIPAWRCYRRQLTGSRPRRRA